MTENTAKALKAYNDFLKKHKLEENKEYSVNFELKTLMEKNNIQTLKFHILIDDFELSPMLVADCFDQNGFVSYFSFADPKYILDRYDRAAILDEINELSSHDYNIKLGKTIIDKLNIKL